MDYTRNIDLTVENGKPVKRRYQVSGKKVIISCKQCSGSVTQYVEDTVYQCRIHKNGISQCDADSGVCRKPKN